MTVPRETSGSLCPGRTPERPSVPAGTAAVACEGWESRVWGWVKDHLDPAAARGALELGNTSLSSPLWILLPWHSPRPRGVATVDDVLAPSKVIEVMLFRHADILGGVRGSTVTKEDTENKLTQHEHSKGWGPLEISKAGSVGR